MQPLMLMRPDNNNQHVVSVLPDIVPVEPVQDDVIDAYHLLVVAEWLILQIHVIPRPVELLDAFDAITGAINRLEAALGKLKPSPLPPVPPRKAGMFRRIWERWSWRSRRTP